VIEALGHGGVVTIESLKIFTLEERTVATGQRRVLTFERGYNPIKQKLRWQCRIGTILIELNEAGSHHIKPVWDKRRKMATKTQIGVDIGRLIVQNNAGRIFSANAVRYV